MSLSVTYFSVLPREVLFDIFGYFSAKELNQTCVLLDSISEFASVFNDNNFWLSTYRKKVNSNFNIKHICLRAMIDVERCYGVYGSQHLLRKACRHDWVDV